MNPRCASFWHLPDLRIYTGVRAHGILRQTVQNVCAMNTVPNLLLLDCHQPGNARLELTVANLPEDALGQSYEYLIKKFADDSGHTAAEF